MPAQRAVAAVLAEVSALVGRWDVLVIVIVIAQLVEWVSDSDSGFDSGSDSLAADTAQPGPANTREMLH